LPAILITPIKIKEHLSETIKRIGGFFIGRVKNGVFKQIMRKKRKADFLKNPV